MHEHNTCTHLQQVWLKESEDVTWDQFLEALTSIGKGDVAKSVKEKHFQVKEEDKDEVAEEEDRTESTSKENLVSS